MSSKSIRVFAPATVANLVCGFDVMGFAVDAPGDIIEMKLEEHNEVIIEEIHGDGGKLPKEADKNTVSISVLHFLNHLGIKKGVSIKLFKQMPLGSGLGSSSASTIGGVFAINELLGRPLKREELLPFAMEGEKLACGAAHADNVAPALLGGFVLVRSYDPLDVVKLPKMDGLFCTLINPHITVNTKDARAILPKNITLEDGVKQWGNIGGVVAGICLNDKLLLTRSLEDYIVEPVRSKLIPGFDDAKKSALEVGALGGGISGSGPSIFMLSDNEETAQKIGDALKTSFFKHGLESTVYQTKVNYEGPKVWG
ncbi:MAG: homoserine kinase [Cytophagales bacterium]